ncbi:MAG: hypothetical protein ABIN25_05585 [Ginsengibacter sp.]
MKLAITYLLLFTYATVMLKPLLPYTSDLIAHVFWYKDHVGTVHSHNGKFHVHKEVMEAAKSNATEKDLAMSKKDGSTTDHTVIKEFNHPAAKMNMSKHICSISPSPITTYLSLDYPPPKF